MLKKYSFKGIFEYRIYTQTCNLINSPESCIECWSYFYSYQSYTHFNGVWPDEKTPSSSILSHYALGVNMYFWVIFYHRIKSLQIH